MQPNPIRELHYIAPLANLDSIFDKGILSHNEATPHKKADVSMDSVQKIRAEKDIPAEAMGQARKIHDCTNLYFNAKNPMLAVRQKEKDTICVLRLKPELMNLPQAVISDRNAAVKDAKFYTAAVGVDKLAMKTLFAEFWTSKYYNTPEQNKINGQLRCAELLLPHKIHPSYIGGMYVASEAVKQAVLGKFPLDKFPDGCPVPITINPSFFFGQEPGQPTAPLDNRLYPNPVEYQETPRVVIDLTHEETTAEVVKIEAVKNEIIDLTDEPIKDAPEPQAVAVAKPTVHTSPKRGIERWLVQKKQTPTEAPIPYEHTLTIPAHITLKKGNLLDSKMQTLTNTVNCKGAMGAGIALSFKTRYKSMFEEYKGRCASGSVKPGLPYIYQADNGKIIINFPTKDHWKNPSNLAWIEKGLGILKANYKAWGITSLAIPPLGCGKGGLDWRIVRTMIVGILSDLDIPIEVYEPN